MSTPLPPLLPPDVISIRNLELQSLLTGPDTWHRANKRQPIVVNVSVRAPVALAGKSDLVAESVHYGSLTKAIAAVVENNELSEDEANEWTPKRLANAVIDACFKIGAEHIKLRLSFPKKLLRADSSGVELTKHRFTPYGSDSVVINCNPAGEVSSFVENLRVYTIIGVNPWERLEKQEVVISYELVLPESVNIDLVHVTDRVTNIVESSSYQTIEALVTELARYLCVEENADQTTVKAEKPRAIAFAAGPSVQVTRSKRYYSTSAAFGNLSDKTKPLNGEHVAYLGMGSNLGERAALLSAALVELENRNIRILQTSSLYESAPMYVEDQPMFLNAVCKVATKLTPHELLRACQDVEKNALGRVKLIDKGPRTIDLDILLYDDTTVRDGEILSIPHLLMLEREFVLRPLVEIAGNYIHPVTTLSIKEHFEHICPPSDPSKSDLVSVVPLLREGKPSRQLVFDTVQHKRTPTGIMAILNVTPDSFSDGGSYLSDDEIISVARQFIKDGAIIIDIGGQSTNPKSTNPGPDIELSRVLPAIKLLRSLPEFDDVAISVDTYYASVAEGAINAGADIINDVSAGLLDPDMLTTAAKLDVPIILMHMRGTPQTMSKLTKYKDNDVISGVAEELATRVREAERAGIKRWNIILDPGIGFAKNQIQNLALIRELKRLRISRPEFEGLPWLLGSSRKKFVGDITGVKEPRDRVLGTGATVVSCIAGGADIIRVHDVKEMEEVVKMADAIYKTCLA
ncbi:Dihydropteroate synthase-like protein [Dipodascopsis uninucleata]